MSLSPTEVETIVRVVLQRLRSASAPSQTSLLPIPSKPVKPADPSTLIISERVVTLRTVEGRLSDVRTLRVPTSAVITPAVHDELRHHNIQLERMERVANDSATSQIIGGADSSSLLLLADSMLSVHDPVFTEVVSGSGNFQSDSCRIAAHLNSGGQGSIWWSKSPFAALRGTMTNKSLRAIQLPRADDFTRAMKEADPNVLIVDALTWQSNQVVGLAKQWRSKQG